MKRYELSAAQWRRVGSFLPGRAGWVGVTAKDNRTFVNGVLWVLRSGAQWKDLPPGYGNWESVHKGFTRWARAGVWGKIFQVLLEDPDNRYVMVDSTIVRAHQRAACAKGGQSEALGRSQGGLSTKIHLLADAQGRPVRFSHRRSDLVLTSTPQSSGVSNCRFALVLQSHMTAQRVGRY